jgi:hypothetical protein
LAAALAASAIAAVAAVSVAQTPPPQPAPSTRPSTPSANETLDRLLTPTTRPGGGVRPLQPAPTPGPVGYDRTTGGAAVAPGAEQLTLQREGTFIVDRTGRLTRGADNASYEFAFDADGRAMRDPPVVILPNLKLMGMQDAVKNSNRDLRFRVTGMLTEYQGRNYVLLDKFVVIPD